MPRPLNGFAFGSLTRGALGRSAWNRRRLIEAAGRGQAGHRPTLERLEERRLLDALVFTGLTELASGETIAREFGAEQLGGTARIREFEIRNDGDEFTLADLVLPDGFVLVQDFSSTTVADGESVTFSVALDTDGGTAGAKSGDITFTWDVGDDPQQYTFAVDGELTPAGGPRVVDLFTDSRGGVWIDFDEPLDTSFIDAAALRVYAAGDDDLVGSADDTRVAGTLTYDADARQVRFLPDNLVEQDYRVEIIDNRLFSMSGERLDGEFAGLGSNGYSGDGVEGGYFHAAVDVSEATDVARMDYTVGTIDIDLTPDITPGTVANFHAYADAGRWNGTFAHRSVTDFVVQGGGFFVDGDDVSQIETFDPIVNEFDGDLMSNVRGTMAMAKLGNDPDSATSQWFYNIEDNSSNLDDQNGGFTVFATLRGGTAYEVMDQMNALAIEDASSVNGALSSLPVLDNYDGPPLSNDELVHLERVGAGASYGAVTFTGLVLDISGAEADPVGGAHYVHDLGILGQDTLHELDLGILNTGASRMTVTAVFFDDGTKYSIAPTNDAGNSGDDWSIVNGESVVATLGLDVSALGEFSDTLTFRFAQDGAVFEYVVALQARVTPSMPGQPDLAMVSDTGFSNADDITQLDNSTPGNTLVFRVDDVVPGATITLYADDTAIGSLLVPDGATSVFVETDGATALADGEYAISAVQTMDDIDSLPSGALHITIDTSTPVFDPVGDQELVVGDLLVLDIQTDEETAGHELRYEFLAAPAGASIDVNTGEIEWDSTGILGDQQFRVQASDLAGNTRVLEFAARVVPATPGAPDLANWADSGSSQFDDLTKNNNSSMDLRLQFVVVAVAEGATVTIYADDVAVGTVVVAMGDTTARVTSDGSTTIPDGDVQFTATQTIDGVESAASEALQVEIDATGPIFEEVTDHELHASVNLEYLLDLDTPEELLPVTGIVYELVTAPDGVDFQADRAIITWTPTLADVGPHDFTVTAEDDAGNVTTFDFEVTVAGPPPGAPDLLEGFDTGNDATDNVTSRNNSSAETTLDFLVTDAVQGSIVRLYANGVLVGSALVPIGQTEIVVTTDGVTTLEDGTTRFTASQMTANGESADSEILLVVVDTAGPEFNEVDPNNIAYVGFPVSLDLSTDDEDSGRYIRYSALEKPFGANLTPTNGRIVWSPTSGQIGDQTFIIQAEDDAGNFSEYEFAIEVASADLPAEGMEIESGLADAGKRRIFLTPAASGQYMVLLSEPADEEQFWLRILDSSTLEVLDSDRTNSSRPAAITFQAEVGRGYRLEVESYQDATGDFTLSIVPDPDGRPEDAHEVDLIGLDRFDGNDVLLGQFSSQTLSERVDQTFLSFVAVTTGSVDITLYTADGLAGRLELYDGSDLDNLVEIDAGASPDVDENAYLTADLEEGVTYYIKVLSESRETTGRFSARIAAAADFSETFPIDLGTLEDTLSLEGTIFPGTDQDWFSFTADRDGPVLFGSTGSFTLSLRAKIEDVATGEQVALASELNRIQPYGRFDALAGHTYRIKFSSIGDSWGDYTLALAYDEYGNAANAMPLDLAATPVGDESDGLIAELDESISSLAEEDWYTFQAPLAGGLASFSLTTTPGLLAAHFTIYIERPGGDLETQRISRDEGATGGFSFNENLSPGATYYLRVKHLDDSFLGDYHLRVAIDGNNTAASADDLGALTTVPTVVEGQTSSLDDIDYFQFTASITGAVIVELADGGPAQRITIYNAATGARIAKATPKKNKAAQIRFDALQDEAYLLLVEPHKKEIGDYTVTLMVDDIGLSSQAATIDFEQRALESEADPLLATIEGEISVNLDQDWYTFVAPTGATTAYFAMDANPGELFSDLTVYARSPAGGLRKLARSKDTIGDGRAEVRVNLTEGAEYWVHAASIKGRSAGAYTIRAEIDYNNTFATADDLGTLADRLDATGFALDRKDIDIYRVTVDRDGLLHLAFAGGPLLKAKVRLYAVGNTNQPVAHGTYVPGGPPLALSHAVSEGESFFVEIQPRGKTSAGAYSLSLDYDPIIFG
jgi:cyclophilin family peptidyl-prolyl cis-trans isomerase